MKNTMNFKYGWQEQQDRNFQTPLEQWVDALTPYLAGACLGAIIGLALVIYIGA